MIKVQDSHHVGVMQAHHDLRLGHEATQDRLTLHDVGRQEFGGQRPTQELVVSPIDRGHAAPTELGLECVPLVHLGADRVHSDGE